MKYTMEKVLHQIIKDCPEASRIDEMYRLGFVTLIEAFELIAEMLKEI